MVSAGHVGGTRGQGMVSSAADVLWICVVRGMSGVDGVCEMCMCLARGGVGGEGGEWMRGLGLDFTNHVGTGGVFDVCLCFGCGGVVGEWVSGLDQGLEGGWWVFCLCKVRVWILCVDGRSRYLCIVLVGYLCI